MGNMINRRGRARTSKVVQAGRVAAATGEGVTRQKLDSDLVLRSRARALLQSRAALDRHLDADLVLDPALNILLFLFAETGGTSSRPTTVCCTAAHVPRTTALRWINLLQQRGLILESDDPDDRRVTLLRLSRRATEALKAWLQNDAVV